MIILLIIFLISILYVNQEYNEITQQLILFITFLKLFYATYNNCICMHCITFGLDINIHLVMVIKFIKFYDDNGIYSFLSLEY